MEEEEGEGSSSNSLQQPDEEMEEAEEGEGAPRKEELEERRRGSSRRTEREEEGEEEQGGSRRRQEKGEEQGGSRRSEEKEEEEGASWSQDATGAGTENSEASWRWKHDGWPPGEAGQSGPLHPASSRRPLLPPFHLGSLRREETMAAGIAGGHDGRSVEGLLAARRRRGLGRTSARFKAMRLGLTSTMTSLISFTLPKGSRRAEGKG